MEPKRGCRALKLPSAGTGLEGPEKVYLEMEQTDVDGFSLAGCTRILKQGGDFPFQAN